MAYRVFVTPAAAQDLSDYADRINEDSKSRSKRWLTQAWEQIWSLAEMPSRFPVIPESQELGTELRQIIFHSHRIIYRVDEPLQRVEVIRVFHGARNHLDL